MTEHKSDIRTLTWAIIGIIISWITIWIFIFSPFGLLAWIAILIYLIYKKSNLKWYILFSAWLFVPCFNFVTGAINYFKGTAVLHSAGGPRVYHGIDQETRVTSVSSGCIFIGFEPFVFPANNAAVRLCTKLFGYQKGSYSGVFPTEEEALDIISSGDTITVSRNQKFYEFQVFEKKILLDTMEMKKIQYPSIPLQRIIGKTIADQCFLFQQIDSIDNGTHLIYLVDIENKILLTQYEIY